MSPTLDIGDALSYGVDRLTTRGGAIPIGAYVLFQVATQVSFQSLFADLLTGSIPVEQMAQMNPLAFDLPVAVSGIFSEDATVRLTGHSFSKDRPTIRDSTLVSRGRRRGL